MNPDFLLTHHLQNRKLLKKLLASVDEGQANEIPTGFNNNIIWNCAHVISVQQTLMYDLCGHAPRVDKKLIHQFTIGTRPTEYVDAAFIQNVGDLLYNTSIELAEDFKKQEFIVQFPFMTAIKVELTNIGDVLAFNNYHEGLHLGVITSLLKCVKK